MYSLIFNILYKILLIVAFVYVIYFPFLLNKYIDATVNVKMQLIKSIYAINQDNFCRQHFISALSSFKN